jgi:hypothetical protein
MNMEIPSAAASDPTIRSSAIGESESVFLKSMPMTILVMYCRRMDVDQFILLLPS